MIIKSSNWIWDGVNDSEDMYILNQDFLFNELPLEYMDAKEVELDAKFCSVRDSKKACEGAIYKIEQQLRHTSILTKESREKAAKLRKRKKHLEATLKLIEVELKRSPGYLSEPESVKLLHELYTKLGFVLVDPSERLYKTELSEEELCARAKAILEDLKKTEGSRKAAAMAENPFKNEDFTK
jgi:hypothetical protein